MEKVYGGTILGGEGFIEALLQEIGAVQRGKAETSYRKSLSAVVLPGGIVAAVRQYLEESTPGGGSPYGEGSPWGDIPGT